ncbi:MAG: HAMP domain-containing histidine kinase [Candidatus Delongbacteria bacterium]|nr:HAMP domain-containing histidine kinase [Candidatus Delongbacteria bacterium]
MLDRVSGIYANAVLIEWTIENLLKNSIESLKDGENGEIIIKLFEEKEKIIIEVCDNGSGIPSSIKKNVFETGFTTKKRGWGLGLSLSKKVISQYHKGSIFIKQTGQKGTVFRIELNKYV